MRDDKVIQQELDEAQADLQRHVAQLKEVVTAKLETPTRILEGVRGVVTEIERNAVLATAAAFAVGFLLGTLRRGSAS